RAVGWACGSGGSGAAGGSCARLTADRQHNRARVGRAMLGPPDWVPGSETFQGRQVAHQAGGNQRELPLLPPESTTLPVPLRRAMSPSIPSFLMMRLKLDREFFTVETSSPKMSTMRQPPDCWCIR